MPPNVIKSMKKKTTKHKSSSSSSAATAAAADRDRGPSSYSDSPDGGDETAHAGQHFSLPQLVEGGGGGGLSLSPKSKQRQQQASSSSPVTTADNKGRGRGEEGEEEMEDEDGQYVDKMSNNTKFMLRKTAFLIDDSVKELKGSSSKRKGKRSSSSNKSKFAAATTSSGNLRREGGGLAMMSSSLESSSTGGGVYALDGGLSSQEDWEASQGQGLGGEEGGGLEAADERLHTLTHLGGGGSSGGGGGAKRAGLVVQSVEFGESAWNSTSTSTPRLPAVVGASGSPTAGSKDSSSPSGKTGSQEPFKIPTDWLAHKVKLNNEQFKVFFSFSLFFFISFLILFECIVFPIGQRGSC